jgi:hypothetical protein
MSEYDYEDSYKVSVDFPIVNSEDERRVEKKMADACREGLYWELGLTSYYKLNLNNPKQQSTADVFCVHDTGSTAPCPIRY